MAEEVNSNNENVAIWNIYDVDKSIIYELERKKTDLLLNFFSLEDKMLTDAVNNFILTSKTIMEKYSLDFCYYELTYIDIEAYNIYDLERNFNIAKTRELKKIFFEKYIFLWNKFLKDVLKISLGFAKIEARKKLFRALFSFANMTNPDLVFERFRIEYLQKLLSLKLADNLKNWFSYLLTKNVSYDLDFMFLNFGFARIGKSTLSFDIERRRRAFLENEYLPKETKAVFQEENLKKILIYSQRDYMRFNSAENTLFIHDEASLTSNRRFSMLFLQNRFLQAINGTAYRHNIHIVNIQNYKDFDASFKRKANGLIFIYKRGYALLFAKPKNFAFLTQENSTLEDMSKNEELFNSLEGGLKKLKSLPSYIGILTISDISSKYPDLWDLYEKEKSANLTSEFQYIPQREQMEQPKNDINVSFENGDIKIIKKENNKE